MVKVMGSAINKKNVIKAMRDEAGEQGVSATAGILLALVEIREAIEDGFAMLQGTQTESFNVLFGCKETLDAFLQRRLGSEEVLAKVAEEVDGLRSETEEIKIKIHKNYQDWRNGLDEVVKTLGDGFDSGKGPEDDEPPDEQKKSSVTQTEGSSGRIPSGSGKT